MDFPVIEWYISVETHAGLSARSAAKYAVMLSPLNWTRAKLHDARVVLCNGCLSWHNDHIIVDRLLPAATLTNVAHTRLASAAACVCCHNRRSSSCCASCALRMVSLAATRPLSISSTSRSSRGSLVLVFRKCCSQPITSERYDMAARDSSLVMLHLLCSAHRVPAFHRSTAGRVAQS